MKLKEYLNKFEPLAFGPLLSKFKTIFEKRDFEMDYYDVYDKLLIRFGLCITTELNAININSITIFKNFILSSSKEKEFDNCRSLKKVLDIDKLIAQFDKDYEFENVESSTKLLLNHIDENGHVYYAIANSLENSDLGLFPKEVIGHIFHYVDDNINL